MGLLVSQTVDPEEIIKQYNWLCLVGQDNQNNRPDVSRPENDGLVDKAYEHNLECCIGLQNLLESIMMRMWGGTIIYRNDTNTCYLVIMPDGTTTYYMQRNEHDTFYACKEGPIEGDLTWTQRENGDMVPVGYMFNVSIISVEPVIREKVLEYISEDSGYYEQYLEPTT